MKNMTLLRHLVAFSLLTFSSLAAATNGYFTHGVGVKNKALAGAGTADPQEAIATSINPAAAVLVGDRFEAGLAIFSPRRSYTASNSLANGQGGAFTIGQGAINSDSEFFPIPYLAKTWAIDEESAWGISIYGRGGMNTDYRGGSALFDPDGPGPAPVMTLPGPYGAGNAGVNLIQAFSDITYSARSGSLNWGVAAVLAAQAFRGNGFGSFAPYTETFAASGGTTFPSALTNNSHDFSYGAGVKLGFIWEASEQFSLGLSYQSKIQMSEFDDYSDLFAEQGGFDIPESLRAGLAYHVNNMSSLYYDIERTSFSSVSSVGNPIEPLFSCPTAGVGGMSLDSCLGGSLGAGFGWNDMTTHKIGYQWRNPSLENWIFRAGMSQGSQPIEESQVLFNMMAPGVIENHFTFGFTHSMRTGREYSMSFMYAPEKKVTGTSPLDPTQTIELKMHQFEIEFGYSW